MSLDDTHVPADGHQTPEDDHGREGSETGLRVLRALHACGPAGLGFAPLCAALQLPPFAVRHALLGLQRRHRVACLGRSTAAIWVCGPFVPLARAQLLASGKH